jgi:hypothetical protein
LPTNAHISSSWTSRVRGGKSHELVVSVVGVIAGQPGEPDDRVAVDTDEALGLSDAAALAEVLEHGAGLVLGQVGVEQGRALALGEAVLAAVAVEQPDVVLLAVAGADGEVAGAPMAVEWAVGVLAAEANEVVHGIEPPVRGARVGSEVGR